MMNRVAAVFRPVIESSVLCGAIAGAPCMIVAVDDDFVVPVPTIMRASGFFRAGDNSSIAADARDDVAHQLAQAPSGWNAVAMKNGCEGSSTAITSPESSTALA